jgi:ectoine hydroxylase-related dioxygenase (phytanoyl-CoA dioxygenase family)
MFPRPAPGITEHQLKETAADKKKQMEAPQHALDPKMLRVLSPPRFAVDDEQWPSYLEANGYVVISSVCDGAQVKQARGLMWDFLESIPGTEVSRSDINTWGLNGDWLPSQMNGIVHGFGFGQSTFAWYLRELPAVQKVFSRIWGTPDLIVSFDGGNVFRPWRHNKEWLTNGGWWHVDQNATIAGHDKKVCVQGLVTLYDATADTGGLCVIPTSHLHHTEMCARVGSSKFPGDFVPIPSTDPLLLMTEEQARDTTSSEEQVSDTNISTGSSTYSSTAEGPSGVSRGTVRCAAGLVCAKAGDLILWDSRCIHCNTPALTALTGEAPNGEALTGEEEDTQEDTEEDASEGATNTAGEVPSLINTAGEVPCLIRSVGYVCMTPASWATAEVLEQRQEAYVQNMSTSHWPHHMVRGGAAPPYLQDQSWEDADNARRCMVVGAARAAPPAPKRGCSIQ